MWHVSTDTLIFISTIILIFGFFLGHAMNGVLSEEGFGPYGNMGVIVAGFLGGIYLMQHYGFSMRDYRLAVSGGLIGSFTLLAGTVLWKNVMHRLGY